MSNRKAGDMHYIERVIRKQGDGSWAVVSASKVAPYSDRPGGAYQWGVMFQMNGWQAPRWFKSRKAAVLYGDGLHRGLQYGVVRWASGA